MTRVLYFKLSTFLFLISGSIFFSGCSVFMPKIPEAESSSTGDRTISIAGGNNISTLVSTTMTANLVVLVRNSNGTVAQGVKIDWTVLTGGGSVSPSTSYTTNLGLASTSFTLGATVGAQTVRATINGTSTYVTFTETGMGAFSTNWTFLSTDTASYTYNILKILFPGTVAALTSLDLTDDDNTPPGFAGGTHFGTAWSVDRVVLGANGCDGTLMDCAVLGGLVTRSGYFTSRVMDRTASGSWTGLRWLSHLPYGKELTHNGVGGDIEAGYASQTPGLMVQNQGLWHMNETAVDTVSPTADIRDFSGNNNHGTATGLGLTYNSAGLLNLSTYFDGVADYINFGATGIPLGSSARTVSLWFKPSGAPLGRTLLSYGNVGADFLFELRRSVAEVIQFYNGTTILTGATTTSNTAKWYHVVATYDGANIIVYLNGAVEIASTAISLTTAAILFKIGGGTVLPWNGYLDEIAIWSRALSLAEISQLYLRGVAHTRFQVKSCTLLDCSDVVAFKGPDNTAATYFTELHNTTAPAMPTATPAPSPKLTTPEMTFTDFVGLGLTVSNNQYFQYKMFLDTYDHTSGTPSNYAGTVQAVEPKPTPAYDQTNPTIVNVTGQSFLTLTGFTETEGANACGEIRYVLSCTGGGACDGTWYYNTGGVWTISSSTYAQASSAATINAFIPLFHSSVGAGTLYWKALINSSGSAACEIDNLNITGTQ